MLVASPRFEPSKSATGRGRSWLIAPGRAAACKNLQDFPERASTIGIDLRSGWRADPDSPRLQPGERLSGDRRARHTQPRCRRVDVSLRLGVRGRSSSLHPCQHAVLSSSEEHSGLWHRRRVQNRTAGRSQSAHRELNRSSSLSELEADAELPRARHVRVA